MKNDVALVLFGANYSSGNVAGVFCCFLNTTIGYPDWTIGANGPVRIGNESVQVDIECPTRDPAKANTTEDGKHSTGLNVVSIVAAL